MFKKRLKKYNVKKIIFSLYNGKDISHIEIVGSIFERNFLLFFKKNIIEYPNPKEIIKEWRNIGFIKISPRDFISINNIIRISYRMKDFFIER